jgi:chromosome partitioning protein
VTNRKGGVGKTTTSVNLAFNIASKGYEVLLIDLDTQGHLQTGLGVHDHFMVGIHDMLKMGKFYRNGVHPTSVPTLDFIPAHVNFDISELASESAKLKKLFRKIKEKKEYDFCIIDTPPTSDILLKNALKVSDYALVPMQCEYLSLVGVLQFLRIFYKNSISVRSDIELLGVVPTMYNKSMMEHTEILDKLELSIGKEKILPSIRRDVKLAKSFIEGVPLCKTDPKARGAVDYDILSTHILNRIEGE